MKYTKAPWAIWPTGGGEGELLANNPNHNPDTGKNPLITIARFAKLPSLDDGALIAAAPELMEALKALIHAVESETEPAGRIVDAIQNATKIIAKAEWRE